MKTVILGDVHLGKSLNIGKAIPIDENSDILNSRVKDQVDLLYWVFNYCVDNSIKNLIITGDVYEDPRPHPTIIKAFMAWLTTCASNGIQVEIIAGNHDIIRTGAYRGSALDIVEVIKSKTVHYIFPNVYKEFKKLKIDNVTYVLAPYRDYKMYCDIKGDSSLKSDDCKKIYLDELKECLGNETGIKVLVGHQAFEGSIYVGDEIDDERNELFFHYSVFSDFDYVWMGHIHKPQVLSKKNPYACHIGSMDRSDYGVGETDHNKRIIVIDGSKEFFKEVELPNRHLRKISIDIPANEDPTEFAINYLMGYSKNLPMDGAIVNLDVSLNSETTSLDRVKIEDYLYNILNIYHISRFSESINISVVGVEDSVIDSGMSVQSAVKAWIEKDEEFDEDDSAEVMELAMECIRESQQK